MIEGKRSSRIWPFSSFFLSLFPKREREHGVFVYPIPPTYYPPVPTLFTRFQKSTFLLPWSKRRKISLPVRVRKHEVIRRVEVKEKRRNEIKRKRKEKKNTSNSLFRNKPLSPLIMEKLRQPQPPQPRSCQP